MLREFVDRYFRKSLHRQMLEERIVKNAFKVKGRVLELGSKNRRYDHLFTESQEILASDIDANSNLEILSIDAREIPFPDESFDTVVAFEVFEYILETKEVLREINRVLKHGGGLHFSVPFMCPIHGGGEAEELDSDLIRYTGRGCKTLLDEEFKDIQIESFGGRWQIIYDVWFSWVRTRKSRLLKLLLTPFGILLKPLVCIFDSFSEKDLRRFVMGYYIVCKK
ncbi:MAG: methyltransferase domain-containing protein [Bdellovibrionota bacterium]